MSRENSKNDVINSTIVNLSGDKMSSITVPTNFFDESENINIELADLINPKYFAIRY